MAPTPRKSQYTQMTVRAAAARLAEVRPGSTSYTVQKLLAAGTLDGGFIIYADNRKHRGVYPASLEAYVATLEAAKKEQGAAEQAA